MNLERMDMVSRFLSRHHPSEYIGETFVQEEQDPR